MAGATIRRDSPGPRQLRRSAHGVRRSADDGHHQCRQRLIRVPCRHRHRRRGQGAGVSRPFRSRDAQPRSHGLRRLRERRRPPVLARGSGGARRCERDRPRGRPRSRTARVRPRPFRRAAPRARGQPACAGPPVAIRRPHDASCRPDRASPPRHRSGAASGAGPRPGRGGGLRLRRAGSAESRPLGEHANEPGGCDLAHRACARRGGGDAPADRLRRARGCPVGDGVLGRSTLVGRGRTWRRSSDTGTGSSPASSSSGSASWIRASWRTESMPSSRPRTTSAATRRRPAGSSGFTTGSVGPGRRRSADASPWTSVQHDGPSRRSSRARSACGSRGGRGLAAASHRRVGSVERGEGSQRLVRRRPGGWRAGSAAGRECDRGSVPARELPTGRARGAPALERSAWHVDSGVPRRPRAGRARPAEGDAGRCRDVRAPAQGGPAGNAHRRRDRRLAERPLLSRSCPPAAAHRYAPFVVAPGGSASTAWPSSCRRTPGRRTTAATRRRRRGDTWYATAGRASRRLGRLSQPRRAAPLPPLRPAVPRWLHAGASQPPTSGAGRRDRAPSRRRARARVRPDRLSRPPRVRDRPRVRRRRALPQPRRQPDVPLGEQLLLARRPPRRLDADRSGASSAGPRRRSSASQYIGERQRGAPGPYIVRDLDRAPWVFAGTGSPSRVVASTFRDRDRRDDAPPRRAVRGAREIPTSSGRARPRR